MTLDQKRDLLFCGLALFASIAILVVSIGYSFDSSYFPRLLAIFMGALAIALGARVIRTGPKSETETDAQEVRSQLAGFGKVVAAVLVYLGAIQISNYTIATVVFLLAMMAVLGERNFLRLGLIAIAMTGLLYYLFFIFLGVTPPEGLLAFS